MASAPPDFLLAKFNSLFCRLAAYVFSKLTFLHLSHRVMALTWAEQVIGTLLSATLQRQLGDVTRGYGIYCNRALPSSSTCSPANSQPNRRHLERLLVRRHLQPDGGDGADHLPALHPPPGRRCTPWKRARPSCSSKPMENRIFPEGKTPRAATTTTCAGRASRTSRRPRCTPVVGEHVFPFLRSMGGDGSAPTRTT
jgi:hypothetical protein